MKAVTKIDWSQIEDMSQQAQMAAAEKFKATAEPVKTLETSSVISQAAVEDSDDEVSFQHHYSILINIYETVLK